MEDLTKLQESPKMSVIEILTTFCDDFSYKVLFLDGTDKLGNIYNIQFLKPLESSDVADNHVALNSDQNRECVRILQEDLDKSAVGRWFVQSHRFPIHISIEQVDPVEENTD